MAKQAIATGIVGASSEATIATPAPVVQGTAYRTAPTRSATKDDTNRPSASPAQNSDSASVACATGAASRYRTSQLETPISAATYVAIAMANATSGSGTRRPLPIGAACATAPAGPSGAAGAGPTA